MTRYSMPVSQLAKNVERRNYYRKRDYRTGTRLSVVRTTQDTNELPVRSPTTHD